MMKKRTMKRKGFIGIDEVGRGPLAGPVTVCACYIEDVDEVRKLVFPKGIKDSKKLKISERETIYTAVTKKLSLSSPCIYVVASKSAAYIDKHGLTKSIHECVVSAVKKLRTKGVDIHAATIRLDAGLRVGLPGLFEESFVKGDEKFVEIAVASIIAKVSRDRLMQRLSTKHPGYGWEKNAGYGTQVHRDALRKLGINLYHRRSFLKFLDRLE
jgi:ribonuclease HII